MYFPKYQVQSRLVITRLLGSTKWNRVVNEARYRLYSARGATTPKTPQQQPKPMCWLRGVCVIYKTN